MNFRNQNNRFIFRMVLFLLLLFIIDRGIGMLLYRFYFKQDSGLYYRTTYSIDSNRADILVFGSSRANHHYVPEVFEDSQKMSFYNTGRDGSSILFSYAVFSAIIDRYTPKIVLFDITPGELNYNPESYERLSSLLPYYHDHPGVQQVVALRSPFEKVKLLSSIYPYNSTIITIALGNSSFNKSRKKDRHGYVPVFNQMPDNTSLPAGSPNFHVDLNKLSAINSIVCACKKKHIRLIFVESPIYFRITETRTSCILAENTKKYDVEYYDYCNEAVFLRKPSCFADMNHLNDEGATLFSKILANKIKTSRIN